MAVFFLGIDIRGLEVYRLLHSFRDAAGNLLGLWLSSIAKHDLGNHNFGGEAAALHDLQQPLCKAERDHITVSLTLLLLLHHEFRPEP